MLEDVDVVLTEVPTGPDTVLVVVWCLAAVIVYLLGHLMYEGRKTAKLRKANVELQQLGVNRLHKAVEMGEDAVRKLATATAMLERATQTLNKAKRLSDLTQALITCHGKMDARSFDGTRESAAEIVDWLIENDGAYRCWAETTDPFNDAFHLEILVASEEWLRVEPTNAVVMVGDKLYLLEDTALVLGSR